MERAPINICRHQTKLTLAAVAVALLGAAAAGLAKESSAPLSIFRQYFWGARQAYEERDFDKAERLFRTYQSLGSPSDPLLKLAGCDPKWEVSVFTEALKEVRVCLGLRPNNLSWTDGGQAKLAIFNALRAGNVEVLKPYVDCAPTDLVAQTTTCGTRIYRQAADLKRLATMIQKNSEILDPPAWREFPVKPDDPQRIRWMLYPSSDHWKPCGLAGAPIISLRQDPSGEIRIAGFAASCLEQL